MEKNEDTQNEGLEDCKDSMWGLICNVDGGNFTNQSEEWMQAFESIKKQYINKVTDESTEEESE